jgi:hypothetical protein
MPEKSKRIAPIGENVYAKNVALNISQTPQPIRPSSTNNQ